MKFLLIVLLFASTQSLGLLNKFRKFENRKKNLAYEFLAGISEENKIKIKQLNECYDKNTHWREIGESEEDRSAKKDRDSLSLRLLYLTKKFEEISNKTTQVIDLLCATKNSIIKHFSEKNRRRRLYQKFIDKRSRVKEWNFHKYIKNNYNAILKEAGHVISGKIALKTTIIEGIDWSKRGAKQIAKFISEKLDDVLKPILDDLEESKPKIFEILTSHRFIKLIREYFKCLIHDKTVKLNSQIKEKLINHLRISKEITHPKTWVIFAVNLSCDWHDLKDGSGYLISGTKAIDRHVKYRYYGKFFGIIAKIMGK